MKRVLLALLLAAAPASAREYDVNIVIDDVDELYDLNEAGELSDEDLELLVALFYRPLDINRADRYLLFDLPEISYDLADGIVSYRSEHGPYADVYDLRSVPGMTDEVFDSIRPFVVVGETAKAEETDHVRGQSRVGYLHNLALARTGDATYDAPNAFAQVYMQGFTYFGAGGLLMLRPMTQPVWDYSRGTLVAEGESNTLTLEGLNLYATYGFLRVIAGSYDVGFGERLTFDSTLREHPRGWDERFTQYLRRDDGDVRPRRNLRGLAVTLDGINIPLGWVDATAFVSYQHNDLYQYDMQYEPDEYMGAQACETDGDCPSGFTCRDDNTCVSSRIYDADNNESITFTTIEDAYTELITGGNLTWSLDERTQLGLTAYRSEVEFTYGEPGAPNFSYSASFPRDSVFGAVGLDGSMAFDRLELAGELTSTLEGNVAGIARAVLTPLDWVEVQLIGRTYTRDYENPHSRATSSRLEVFGSTRRNQRGGRFTLLLKPAKRLKLRTSADYYEQPWQSSFDESGALVWRQQTVNYVRFSQNVSYGVTSKEDVSLQVDYNNNDLDHNGREEWYGSSGDDTSTLCNTDVDLCTDIGRGEKRTLRLSASTRRLSGVRLAVVYVAGWEDDEKPTQAEREAGVKDDDFGTEQSIRFTAGGGLWEGGRLSGSVRVWFDDQVTPDDPGRVAYISLKQRLHALATVSAVWGVNGEQNAEGVWGYNQFALISVDSRF